MPEIKIVPPGEKLPREDLVLIRTRLADNNSVVTDIIAIKDSAAVKTITDRQLSPDMAISKASEIADQHEIDVIYVLNEV